MNEAVEKEIALSRQIWVDAMNSVSPELFISVLTDDAVWMVPNRGAVIGKRDIYQWIHSLMQEYTFRVTLSDIRVRRFDAMAAESGRFHTELEKVDTRQTAAAHESRYVLLWREIDGKWKIDRYIDGMDWLA